MLRRPVELAEFATVLRRTDASHLSKVHLAPMTKRGTLERRYPETPAHPLQAYRTANVSTEPTNNE